MMPACGNFDEFWSWENNIKIYLEISQLTLIKIMIFSFEIPTRITGKMWDRAGKIVKNFT
jgi:hypothetical protein